MYKNRQTSYCFYFLIVILILLCVIFSSASGATNNADTTNNNSPHKCVNELSNKCIFNNDMVTGNKNAKVIFIEYFSPTCTHCLEYHLKVFPELKRKYIDTGKIAYVMRECVGNKQDLDASILARCLGDTKSYINLMHHMLRDQDSWAYDKDYKQTLIEIAKQYGISESQYQTCLADDSITDILFSYARLISNDTNFIGTPSFYINSQLFNGLLNIEELSKVIDSQLSKEDEP